MKFLYTGQLDGDKESLAELAKHFQLRVELGEGTSPKKAAKKDEGGGSWSDLIAENGASSTAAKDDAKTDAKVDAKSAAKDDKPAPKKRGRSAAKVSFEAPPVVEVVPEITEVTVVEDEDELFKKKAEKVKINIKLKNLTRDNSAEVKKYRSEEAVEEATMMEAALKKGKQRGRRSVSEPRKEVVELEKEKVAKKPEMVPEKVKKPDMEPDKAKKPEKEPEKVKVDRRFKIKSIEPDVKKPEEPEKTKKPDKEPERARRTDRSAEKTNQPEKEKIAEKAKKPEKEPEKPEELATPRRGRQKVVESPKSAKPKKAVEEKKQIKIKVKEVKKPAEQENGGNDDEFEIEKILEERKVGNKKEYFVKWKGWNRPEDNTWEPEAALEGSKKMVKDFEKRTP